MSHNTFNIIQDLIWPMKTFLAQINFLVENSIESDDDDQKKEEEK